MEPVKDTIKEAVQNSLKVKEAILASPFLLNMIDEVAGEIVGAFKRGRKVLLCGNGGSAADAQHIAAELSGRFYTDRDPLYAEALHVNTSYLTAVANDYSYEEVYARLVKGMGKPNDVLIGISTSGNSANVLKALATANELGLITVGMTGENGGKMKDHCRYTIKVPSSDTPRIQEAHILIGHIICELVEGEMFAQK